MGVRLMNEEKTVAEALDGIRLEVGAGQRDFAGLAMVVVLGPGPGREERLVVHEVGFAVEQIVHAAVVSLDERPRVIQEGQIDAFVCFPPAVIFQGHPVVLRGVQGASGFSN